MYISESFLFDFIVIVGSIILLILVIRLAYKSDMKHNKPKFETPSKSQESVVLNSNTEQKNYLSLEELHPSLLDKNTEEPSSYNIGDIDSKPPKLKYNNEVYISFRNKVYKAYESYRRSRFNVEWKPDMDGFFLYDNNGSRSVGGSMCAVNVGYDDRNILKLNDPFYIVVTHGILFDIRNYDDYEEKAEYLNNHLKKIEMGDIFYTVELVEDSNLGIYFSTMLVYNNKKLCEDMEKIGEDELFRELISDARQNYFVGEEIYNAKIRDTKNFSN
jgi:hypothetical protein